MIFIAANNAAANKNLIEGTTAAQKIEKNIK